MTQAAKVCLAVAAVSSALAGHNGVPGPVVLAWLALCAVLSLVLACRRESRKLDQILLEVLGPVDVDSELETSQAAPRVAGPGSIASGTTCPAGDVPVARRSNFRWADQGATTP